MADAKPYEKMTVKELQNQLISKGLSASGRKQDLVNRLKAAVGTATAPAVAAGGLEATQAQPGVLEATQAQAAPHTNGLADEPSADEIAADAAAAQAAEETLATAIEEDAAEAAEEAEAEAQEEAEAELDAQEEEELGEPEHISLEDDQTFADEPENHRESDNGEEDKALPESIKQEQEPAVEDVLQEEVGQPQEEAIERVQDDAGQDSKEEEDYAEPADIKQDDEDGQPDGDRADSEWQQVPIALGWRPMPLLKVKNIPRRADLSERDVASLLEASGHSVHSAHFDANLEANNRRTALVRLQPPELPWLAKAGGDRPTDDIAKLASVAVEKLRRMDTPLELGGEQLSFEASALNVELFIGNLTEEWEDDSTFLNAMKAYGHVERSALVRNVEGQAKGYAFVEFARPSEAQSCKAAMEKIEQEMRPDNAANRRKPGSDHDGDHKGAGQFRWEQVKLLRAEWSRTKNVPSLFSRILYISNLKPGFKDVALLRSLFEELGDVLECHLPRNKQTGNSKGFAFVEFKNSIQADLAFRELDGIEHEVLGRLLVSFANPAKHYDSTQGMPSRPSGNGPLSNRISGGGSFEGNRGRFGSMPPGPIVGRGSGGMQGRGPGFGGRFEGGRGAGRFGAGGRAGGFNALGNQMDQSVAMRVQAMQAQQQQTQFQLQAQRMQAQLQAQLRQQQMAMQRQLQQAQQQAQQAQQQAQAAQAAVQAANRKAQQEAEARRREEEQRKAAERAAASRAQPKGYGAYGAGADAAQGDYSGYGSYNAQGGNYGGMGSQAMASQGYGAGMGGNQGYGANAGSYGQEAGAEQTGGYGGNGGGSYSSQAGYGNQQGAVGNAGGYGQGSQAGGYGSYGTQGHQSSAGAAGGNAGYGSQSNYGSNNQGSYGNSGYNQGYGNYSGNTGAAAANTSSAQAAYGQGSYSTAGGYGSSAMNNYGSTSNQGGYGSAAGSKRDSSEYAGYNQSSYGGQSGYGHQDNKRTRY